MTDRICVRGLTVHGFHGVLDGERSQGQEFVIDVELDISLAPAAASDELGDTIDYGALVEALSAVVAGEPVNLIETLAGRLADVCLSDDRVSAASATVHKPQAPIPAIFSDVSVTVERQRP